LDRRDHRTRFTPAIAQPVGTAARRGRSVSIPYNSRIQQ
jgi:hypothetical protein